MMAIEKKGKRGADKVFSSVDTKKRRVEFANDVMIHDEDGEKQTNQEFSAKLYHNFVISAIEDLERVCWNPWEYFISI